MVNQLYKLSNSINSCRDEIRTKQSFSSILFNNINRLGHIFYELNYLNKLKYFGRMLEKSPELETFAGIDGSFLCPFGKAIVRNFSS